METTDVSTIEMISRSSPFELPEEDERPGSPVPVLHRSSSSMSYESAYKPSFEPIFREINGSIELTDTWSFYTPILPRVAILRHPRVLLAFLRFVALQKEVAQEGEEIVLPTLTSEMAEKIMNHSSIKNPPIEFLDDIDELKERISSLVSY